MSIRRARLTRKNQRKYFEERIFRPEYKLSYLFNCFTPIFIQILIIIGLLFLPFLKKKDNFDLVVIAVVSILIELIKVLRKHLIKEITIMGDVTIRRYLFGKIKIHGGIVGYLPDQSLKYNAIVIPTGEMRNRLELMNALKYSSNSVLTAMRVRRKNKKRKLIISKKAIMILKIAGFTVLLVLYITNSVTPFLTAQIRWAIQLLLFGYILYGAPILIHRIIENADKRKEIDYSYDI